MSENYYKPAEFSEMSGRTFLRVVSDQPRNFRRNLQLFRKNSEPTPVTSEFSGSSIISGIRLEPSRTSLGFFRTFRQLVLPEKWGVSQRTTVTCDVALKMHKLNFTWNCTNFQYWLFPSHVFFNLAKVSNFLSDLSIKWQFRYQIPIKTIKFASNLWISSFW